MDAATFLSSEADRDRGTVVGTAPCTMVRRPLMGGPVSVCACSVGLICTAVFPCVAWIGVQSVPVANT